MPYNCFVHLRFQIEIFLCFFLVCFFFLDTFVIWFQSKYLYEPNMRFYFLCMYEVSLSVVEHELMPSALSKKDMVYQSLWNVRRSRSSNLQI